MPARGGEVQLDASLNVLYPNPRSNIPLLLLYSVHEKQDMSPTYPQEEGITQRHEYAEVGSRRAVLETADDAIPDNYRFPASMLFLFRKIPKVLE